MEIISKTTEVHGFLPSILMMILFILLIIMFIYIRDVLSEIEARVYEWFLFALFATAIIFGLFIPTKIEKYRLRVDDSVTAKELIETYEIVEYDKDIDLWIVKEKEGEQK